MVFVRGISAGQREQLAVLFESGLGRQLFLELSSPLPRVSELAEAAAAIAVGQPAPADLPRLVLGTVLFGGAGLAPAAFRTAGGPACRRQTFSRHFTDFR
jgi:hypothetical protein